MDPLVAASRAASSGLWVQSSRMRVVSENLANANSTGATPGAEPYSRKTISFAAALDAADGVAAVRVGRIDRDDKPFRQVQDPSHPAADAGGFVKFPNVDILVELADMREANRSYEANLQTIRQVRGMVDAMIDLLRGDR